ncbi:MAG: DUF3465 domain-containing protein [Gammaproteobacteria bacterium]|nr:DUF3465 domain-containing protein [Gammaproteobacteria bacterium]
MKKLILIAAALAATYLGVVNNAPIAPGTAPPVSPASSPRAAPTTILASAIANHENGVLVQGGGTVTKVLQDDNNGSRHQRFILRLSSGQTLLIAHNIDLAPRVVSLQPGDQVEFNGVFEWNDRGGVVHWTHHDPTGRHAPGWLRHAGQTYQ